MFSDVTGVRGRILGGRHRGGGETYFAFYVTLRVFSGVWYNISNAWSELKKVFAVANPSAGQVNSPSGM